eukprot:scaffold91339_cov48-Phaeocystis_antarctica.AAC.1
MEAAIARAPEAVAGIPVARPHPPSAELPIAARRALRRRRRRAGALPRGHFDRALLKLVSLRRASHRHVAPHLRAEAADLRAVARLADVPVREEQVAARVSLVVHGLAPPFEQALEERVEHGRRLLLDDRLGRFGHCARQEEEGHGARRQRPSLSAHVPRVAKSMQAKHLWVIRGHPIRIAACPITRQWDGYPLNEYPHTFNLNGHTTHARSTTQSTRTALLLVRVQGVLARLALRRRAGLRGRVRPPVDVVGRLARPVRVRVMVRVRVRLRRGLRLEGLHDLARFVKLGQVVGEHVDLAVVRDRV